MCVELISSSPRVCNHPVAEVNEATIKAEEELSESENSENKADDFGAVESV